MELLLSDLHVILLYQFCICPTALAESDFAHPAKVALQLEGLLEHDDRIFELLVSEPFPSQAVLHNDYLRSPSR